MAKNKKGKAAAPKVEKTEPAHALTREELEEIYALRSDTETMIEFDKAIESRNLLPEEKDMILDWAFSAYNNNALEAQDKLTEIALKVENIPIATPTEELMGMNKEELQTLLDSWKTVRMDSVKAIQEIDDARNTANKAIKALEKTEAKQKSEVEKYIESHPNLSKEVQNFLREDAYGETTKALAAKQQELQNDSIKHDIQTLIAAHAKTAEAQVKACIAEHDRAQQREAFKEALKDLAKDARELTKAIGRELGTFKDLAVGHAALTLHDINLIKGARDFFQTQAMKSDFKSYNKECEKLHKEQQKAIEMAQKIANREHIKEHGIDFGKFWGRGRETQPEKITDPDRAKELIEKHSGALSFRRNSILKHLEKQEKAVEKAQSKLERSIGRFERSIYKERLRLQEIGDKILGRTEQGNMSRVMNGSGFNERMTKEILGTQMSFGQDLDQYLKTHDHAHMVNGEKLDFKTAEELFPELEENKIFDEHANEIPLDEIGADATIDGIENENIEEVLKDEVNLDNLELDGIENIENNGIDSIELGDGQFVMDGFDAQDMDAPEIDDHDGPEIGG